jgi:probable phosphoglycerate mutase
VTARIVPALEDAAASVGPGDTVVVVTHGAAVKLGIGGLLGWDATVVRTLGVLANCHWSTVLVPADGAARRLLHYGVGDFASAGAIG